MKKYIIHIKFILILTAVVFLYGFASHRNASKKRDNVNVFFENGENLFISYETVNKLLIQNLETLKNQSKENINLNNLEQFVQNNEMIQNAEIFLTLRGELGAIIKQRTPVLRVANNLGSYYYDEFGQQMPLSDNYSARVPITTSDLNKNNCIDIICLANNINNDEFLRKQIIGIDQIVGEKSNQFELKTRIGNQKIIFGDIKRMNEKFVKLKVFYQKVMINDSIMNHYKTINLKFNGQVVCEK
jgi:cell division protein FtsQ